MRWAKMLPADLSRAFHKKEWRSPAITARLSRPGKKSPRRQWFIVEKKKLPRQIPLHRRKACFSHKWKSLKRLRTRRSQQEVARQCPEGRYSALKVFKGKILRRQYHAVYSGMCSCLRNRWRDLRSAARTCSKPTRESSWDVNSCKQFGFVFSNLVLIVRGTL